MEVNGISTNTNLNYQFPNKVLNAANSASNDIILQTNSSQDWLRGNQIKLPNSIFRGMSLLHTNVIVYKDKPNYSILKLFITNA